MRHYRKLVPELPRLELLRRAFLDELLIGTPESIQQAERLTPTIETHLAELNQQMALQTDLFSLRDRLWMELPALLQLQDRLANSDAKSLAISLEDALETLIELEDNLNNEAPIAVEQIKTWHSRLATHQSEQQSILNRIYEHLLTAEKLTSTDRIDVEALLSTGLFPSQADSLNRSPLQQRQTLRDRFLALAEVDEVETKELDLSQSAPPWVRESVLEADLPLVQMFERLTSAPLVDESIGDVPTHARFRHRLAHLRDHRDRMVERLHRNDPDLEPANLREFQDLAARVRRLTTWLPGHDGDRITSAAHRNACATRCFEQTETTLNDFLAAHRPGQAAWFDTSSDALLQLGQSLRHPALNDETEFARLAKLRSDRKSVLQKGLPIRGVPIPTALPDDPLKTMLTLAIPPNLSDQLPVGKAALGVGLIGERREVTGEGVSLPLGTSNPATVEWLNRPGVDLSRWHAVADFRGHRFSDSLSLKPVGGLSVSTRQPPKGPASVVVEGNDLENHAVLFI
ncbi:MAG: hypothetical protein KDA84_10570, partial [Planctomycetaceae bacterium]|nr:hypothetical protein [Planctomycetaceae bacterium]